MRPYVIIIDDPLKSNSETTEEMQRFYQETLDARLTMDRRTAIQNRAKFNSAARDPDNLAIRMVYTDRDGNRTRRCISPIEVGEEKIKALCLCREQVRFFKVESCSEIELIDSAELLMPVEIEELGEPDTLQQLRELWTESRDRIDPRDLMFIESVLMKNLALTEKQSVVAKAMIVKYSS
jgi:predicted DNA-binding transcriptional regulator YafY